MSEYQALYRKWRPQNFSDVIGQSHIVDTLKNEIKSGRIAHAYLFCGTRGTGKTTTAKILSRAVNCQSPLATGEPCNECDSCLGILSGAIMDVAEIDAASNNGVDNIRGIRNEVIYAPANVKYRVYIIDEVHMLSTAAFNALLKTLEEPPPHVIFILATTESAKIPATVQSRCQRFDFTRITVGDIAQRLSYISEKDGINITHEATHKIAAVADGSMRDALSILDQCTTYDEINLAVVEQLVGITGNEKLISLADYISCGDAGSVLVLVDELVRAGKDIGGLFDSMLNHFRELLICKAMVKPEQVLNYTTEQASEAKKQADKFSFEAIIYIIKQISDSIAVAKWAENPRVLLEACVVKLCKPELAAGEEAILARLANLEQNRPVAAAAQYVQEQPAKELAPVSANDLPFDLDEPEEPTNIVLDDQIGFEQEKDEAQEEAVVAFKPAAEVTQVSAQPTGSLNPHVLLDRIKSARPRIRPNLLGVEPSMQGEALLLVQKRQIAYSYLANLDELNALADAAGCQIIVSDGGSNKVSSDVPLKSQSVDEPVVEKKKAGLEGLLAQKEIFGDKMIIE